MRKHTQKKNYIYIYIYIAVKKYNFYSLLLLKIVIFLKKKASMRDER
jgi:hypothetical protein